MSSVHTERDGDRHLAGIAGAMVPFLAALALVPLRDVISPVNIALLMVVTIVGAAWIGGRIAGAVGAVVAALSFDFFHTEPYLSLRIDAQDDLETTLILLVIGVVVGTLSARDHQVRRAAREQEHELRSIHRVAELAATGMPAELLIDAVCTELTALLQLRSCTFETVSHAPNDQVPLGRSGELASSTSSHVWTRHGFELPLSGASLDVIGDGRVHGRLVLVPTPGTGIPGHSRLAAVAIADQLGAALALAER